MQQSKFFKAQRLFENVTVIAGLAGELCYLVEGSEKALLIDGLTGVGSLKAFVRELTDLPVTLVNTHGHLDHCGANFEFKECRIHPADIALLYEHSDPKRRLEFSKSGAQFGLIPEIIPTVDDVISPCDVRTLPVYDGDEFDLGGVTLKVIAVPGHSFGSIVLLDPARRVVYSGDACNANTLLFLGGSTSIEEYRESLLHLKSFQKDFDCLYGGHGTGAVPKEIVDEAIELCDQIMAGTDDGILEEYVGRPCYYAKKKGEGFRRVDGKTANIAYDKEGIFHTRQ